MIIPTKQPQEIEVWYVLPAVRKELVLALQERNLSQKEIAHLLNLTEPAVSQYLHSKRAKDVTFPPDVKEFIVKACAKIKDQESAYQQIQKINEFIKKTKAICKIHMSVEKGIEGCDVCYK